VNNETSTRGNPNQKFGFYDIKIREVLCHFTAFNLGFLKNLHNKSLFKNVVVRSVLAF